MKFRERLLRAFWCILVYEATLVLLEALHLWIRRLYFE